MSFKAVTQPIGKACMVCVDSNNELSGSNPGPTVNTGRERARYK
jgi:hypothetical protein